MPMKGRPAVFLGPLSPVPAAGCSKLEPWPSGAVEDGPWMLGALERERSRLQPGAHTSCPGRSATLDFTCSLHYSAAPSSSDDQAGADTRPAGWTLSGPPGMSGAHSLARETEGCNAGLLKDRSECNWIGGFQSSARCSRPESHCQERNPPRTRQVPECW